MKYSRVCVWQEVHDEIAWLVQEGASQLFDWCEPLTVKGHGSTASEFLAWALLATEGVVNLSTIKVSKSGLEVEFGEVFQVIVNEHTSMCRI